MAKEAAPKFDPNTEAFQMRAQWKKVDICRNLWHERWSWLLDERQQALEESNAIRKEAADALHQVVSKIELTKSLKPVPVTSTGFIGWIASKPDCQLEIYTSWTPKIPVRLPDAWDNKEYVCKKEALVGVDEDIVRSLANELVDDSLEIFDLIRRAAVSGLPGLPTRSSANLPFPGTGGGFSSTGTMYDSIAA